MNLLDTNFTIFRFKVIFYDQFFYNILEYLTSVKWKEKIDAEFGKTKVARRTSFTDFLPLINIKSSQKHEFLEYLKQIIIDPWFRTTFTFCAVNLDPMIFQQFACYLAGGDTLSAVSVVLEMLKERNNEEADANTCKLIQHQISMKKHKRTLKVIALGLVHHNKLIHSIASRMMDLLK